MEKFLLLYARIDELMRKGPVLIAIEGGSAGGKTTLSERLKEKYDCTVFHMDDFFLRPEQRTTERFAQVGGNIDWERFLQEVLIPLKKREKVTYRKFDCATFALSEPMTVNPGNLTVVEGVYSMHPKLADYYDFTVFLEISEELQRERILARNTPQMAQRFFTEWIPLENVYFEKMQVRECCDVSIFVKKIKNND